VRLSTIQFGAARGALALTLLAFATSCGVQQSVQPPLLEISEVKKLANNQGSTDTTLVAFRGVITYSADHVLFVQDRTGGIKVDATQMATPPLVNTLVEAHGLVLRTSGLSVLLHHRSSCQRGPPI
jgi:hypothetical protein